MVARAEGMVATRDRIVQATMKLALEQAYEDITLAAIAREADVSHQTVLNHFESKEKVAAAAAEQLSRDTAAARARAKPGDFRRAIRILVDGARTVLVQRDGLARWLLCSTTHGRVTRRGSSTSSRTGFQRRPMPGATRFIRSTPPRMFTRGNSCVATFG